MTEFGDLPLAGIVVGPEDRVLIRLLEPLPDDGTDWEEDLLLNLAAIGLANRCMVFVGAVEITVVKPPLEETPDGTT